MSVKTSDFDMVISALCVEGLFVLGGWVPTMRNVTVAIATISFNYTTWLDIAAGMVALIMVISFFRTGGPAMMRMMDSGLMLKSSERRASPATVTFASRSSLRRQGAASLPIPAWQCCGGAPFQPPSVGSCWSNQASAASRC